MKSALKSKRKLSVLHKHCILLRQFLTDPSAAHPPSTRSKDTIEHKTLMASRGWEENNRTTGLGLVTAQPLLLHAKEWSKGCSQDSSFSQCLPIRRLKEGVDTGETELLLWLEPALFYYSGKDNRDPYVLCLVATKSRVFVFSFEGLCIQP